MVQLEEERRVYELEMQQRKAMEEEQRMIAQQEAIEKAALEPKPEEENERRLPTELTGSLPTLNEGDEEEKKIENGM